MCVCLCGFVTIRKHLSAITSSFAADAGVADPCSRAFVLPFHGDRLEGEGRGRGRGHLPTTTDNDFSGEDLLSLVL